MAEEFFIPKLGQTVEEVTLVRWLVEDGVKVSQGQEVMEVETDKAIFPVEANARGILHKGPFKDGQVLPVLTVVAIIGKPEDRFPVAGEAPTGAAVGETAAPAAPELGGATTPAALTTASLLQEGGKAFASPRARKLANEKQVDLAQVLPTGEGGRRVAERDVIAFLAQQPKVSPVAQKVAAEAGVDLRGVAGSGPRGRIVKDDILRAIQSNVEAAPTPTPAIPAAPISLPVAEVSERIPLKGVRAIIVDRMGASVHTTARVTLFMDVDATELVAARTRLKARVEKEWGFAPSYNDLLVLVIAKGLRQFPYMNARLAVDAIERLSRVNIGMAVDTERGLMVPVIRNADQLSLRQVGTEFRSLVERVRANRITPDDLSGGTFTITNLGMYDVDAFTPVINLPEAAILGVGRIAPKAVPQGDQIAVRQMMTLSLVFDHRLIDGAPAARFLQYVKQLIEEPYLLLAE